MRSARLSELDAAQSTAEALDEIASREGGTLVLEGGTLQEVAEEPLAEEYSVELLPSTFLAGRSSLIAHLIVYSFISGEAATELPLALFGSSTLSSPESNRQQGSACP